MYNRLFTKILDSSIWLEDVTTRIVWITLLAAMDEDGYAHFSANENLAIRARVSLSDTEAALVRLMSPDPNSENPANEGRRVERVQGGFLVLNAPEHRKTMNREIQREQTRLRVARHREKQECNAGIVTSALQTVTSASASASASEKKEEKKSTAVRTRVNGLIDSEWIASLKEDQTYQGIDVDRELGKMQNWCKVRDLTPSRRRFVSWLNRDRPISDQPHVSPQHRQNRINFFNAKKQKLNRMIKDPQNPPPWIVKELAEIDSQLRKL
jgi:hypothetical protein